MPHVFRNGISLFLTFNTGTGTPPERWEIYDHPTEIILAKKYGFAGEPPSESWNAFPISLSSPKTAECDAADTTIFPLNSGEMAVFA